MIFLMGLGLLLMLSSVILSFCYPAVQKRGRLSMFYGWYHDFITLDKFGKEEFQTLRRNFYMIFFFFFNIIILITILILALNNTENGMEKKTFAFPGVDKKDFDIINILTGHKSHRLTEMTNAKCFISTVVALILGVISIVLFKIQI